MDQADVDTVLEHFETLSYGVDPARGIYPLATDAFGDPPLGLDDDPRIYALYYDLDISSDGFVGWAGFGISRMEMPMVAQAVLLGGHARVGLEDNLYLERGVYASNAALVERAITIIENLGARVVSPAEGREMLSLRQRN